MRADKHTILDGYTMVDRNIILDFDVITNRHARVDVYALSKDTVLTNLYTFAHLALMPDAGIFTDFCL